MENPSPPKATPAREAAPPSRPLAEIRLAETHIDRVLATEAAGGATHAFAQLVERHAAALSSVVRNSVHDDHLARDLAQEIWIKVYRGLSSFDLERRFRPWLFAIALNHVRDHGRKLGRRPRGVHFEDLQVEPVARDPRDLERREERRAIAAALARVPEPFRTALQLVDVVGLDYEEAAASLECSKGTVKSRVHRGRLAFQAAYLRGDAPARSTVNDSTEERDPNAEPNPSRPTHTNREPRS